MKNLLKAIWNMIIVLIVLAIFPIVLLIDIINAWIPHF